MRLRDDGLLESSSVIANSAMNRERRATGGNSYERELGFDPIRYLDGRLRQQDSVAWLDLCCGRGLALIEAGQHFLHAGLPDRVRLHGVDLVPMFVPVPSDLRQLVQLEAASLHTWAAVERYDLMTCVHGLHYIGDKLGLIQRMGGWLQPTGMLAANLDLANLRHRDGETLGRGLLSRLRANGFAYDRRRRVLLRTGPSSADLGYHYLGADDQAGPNYTGQDAVNSYYQERANRS